MTLRNLLPAFSSLGAFSLMLIPYIPTRNLNGHLPWTPNLLIALSAYLHVTGHVGGYDPLFAPFFK